MVLNQTAYTGHHAALISLILLITFFFFDAHYWHILLPFPTWYGASLHTPSQLLLNKASPQANHGLHDQFVSINHTKAGYESSNTSVGKVVFNDSKGIDASNLSSKGTEAASASTVATPQLKNMTSSAASMDPLPPEIISLKKLEAGLRTVRSALRKIVQKEKSAERALQDRVSEGKEYVPLGAIYRNASIFHQSYIEMERRFKVFVYPEGNEPLVHNGPCKEIYATEGRFIQELDHNKHFVTRDPFKAHVFFLPFSVSKMVSYLYMPSSRDMSPLTHFVREYVETISANYPFWNRSDGTDHFMLSCHDWGPSISRAKANLEKRSIRVLCNANTSEGFVPDKDASLPEINLIGGHIPAALGGPLIRDRKVLAFFAGKEHGPVRPVLYKYWEGKDEDIKVFRNLPADSKYTYQDLMKQSKFCLCPSGYEVNSPRVVEAIYNDCIPVIIADGFVLPFSDVLNWDAFSIKVMQKDIPKLKEILQAIPDSECEEMQARVKQVKRHFLLNQPLQPYDVFHMILHSVWLRRLNIRLDYY